MEKIWIVIKREYLTRVRKRTFIIMSILGPVLIAVFYGIVIWINVANIDSKTILVVDDSELFTNKLRTNERLKFRYSKSTIEKAKKTFSEDEYDGVLYIPNLDIQKPRGLALYSDKSISLELQNTIEGRISRRVKDLKIKNLGLDKEIIENLDADIKLNTVNLGKGKEESTNTTIATIIGFVAAFVSYLLVFLYSTQVMRSVMEEKTNRIVELIIGSLRPFQLMIGKIIGIAGLALTQIFIWIVLTSGLLFLTISILAFLNTDLSQIDPNDLNQGQTTDIGLTQGNLESIMQQISSTVDVSFIVTIFIFYIIFGYLTYSALFAAIGSLGDSEQDTQQFMLPVVLPLILAISVSSAVIRDPTGQLAFWLSMIPFTSPVTMLTRLPFIGMGWELVLSMIIIVVSFLGTTWAAGKIYKVSILLYGNKPTYKQVFKWLISSN